MTADARRAAMPPAAALRAREAELMLKRQRERVRREKQQQKAQRRYEREAERRKRAPEDGGDPDLKGIVPGPQPGQIIDLP
jgi:hypothetical protein